MTFEIRAIVPFIEVKGLESFFRPPAAKGMPESSDYRALENHVGVFLMQHGIPDISWNQPTSHDIDIDNVEAILSNMDKRYFSCGVFADLKRCSILSIMKYYTIN